MAYGDYVWEINAYYDENLRGLADDFVTNDWEEVKDKVHEFISDGHVVEIWNRETGVKQVWESDGYFADFNGESPLFYDDFYAREDEIEVNKNYDFDSFKESKNNGSMKLNLYENKYGIDTNADYRYYDKQKRDGSSIYIAFKDKINPIYFCDVMDYGLSKAVENLGIPFAIESFLNDAGLYIFERYNSGEEFKVTWHFEYNRDYGFITVTSSQLRVDYYKDSTENNEPQDAKVVYDIKTYEQALDFVMNYVQDILNNGVKTYEPPKYDEQLLNNIKLMHNVMTSMNNENAYYSWIYVCPDEASEDDFIYIASNEDEYKDCEDTFYRLFKKYAKDGLYRPTEEEKQFALDACKKLGIADIEVLN